MSWIELHITTTAEYADSLSNQLMLLGAQAITFQDAGDQPIYEPNPHAVTLWSETTVIGLFSEDLPLTAIFTYLENQQAAKLITRFQRKNIADQDWERVCLKHFTPMQYGKRLWVCPSWQAPPDPAAINVTLDPGLAFGTGTHATTRLCLEWLDQHIQQPSLVIDYGCGSGILGLAALKLGAKKVIAIDNDPQALSATEKNAARNPNIASKLQTCLPEELEPVKLSADLLIANILAQPLIELAPSFANLTHSNSTLLLSGILKEQVEQIVAAYTPWFIFSKSPRVLDDWVRLEAQRKCT